MWRIRVAETVTGVIVAEAQPAEAPSFTRELCAKGDWGCSLILDGKANRAVDYRVYATSDRYCWIIDWNGYVVQAGPATSATFNDQDRKLNVTGTGIGALLDQRVVRNPAGDPTKIADPGNVLEYKDLSLRGIMTKLVRDNLSQTNYGLPILLPATDEAGTATRTYYGYDLGIVWARMTELAEVINGPEFEFSPQYWTDGTTLKIRWELLVGSPELGDPALPAAWDYGGALGAIDVDVNAAVGPVHRVWTKGSGDKEDMKSGYAENSAALAGIGYPGVDYVDNDHSSAEEADTLLKWAQDDLATYADPVETWKAAVRVDGLSRSGRQVSPWLGSWSLGDAPLFRLSGHPWILDGSYRRRIIGYSNDTDQTVALKLAENPLII